MQTQKKHQIINGILFQIVWLSAVFGSANGWQWPCLFALAALMGWQLQTTQRASTDVTLIIVAVLMGLIIDSLWIYLEILEYTDKRPFVWLSPVWILCLWAGFGLTINHSMAWLKSHPLLPVLIGLISAPLSYYAGQRIGAITYHREVLTVSAYIGISWSIALPILVRYSRCNDTAKINKFA